MAEDDNDSAAWWATCTILTTEAADAAGRIHPLMPLAIAPADYDAWLDPAHQDSDELRALLTSPAGGRLDARAVSTATTCETTDPQLLDDAPRAHDSP
ncbi:MAG: hypothetical protein QOF84_3841 [Streptomyces sp.]|nr:hypothetical protein [Streptomyces sp.]